jgi:hypothetical protein
MLLCPLHYAVGRKVYFYPNVAIFSLIKKTFAMCPLIHAKNYSPKIENQKMKIAFGIFLVENLFLPL